MTYVRIIPVLCSSCAGTRLTPIWSFNLGIVLYLTFAFTLSALINLLLKSSSRCHICGRFHRWSLILLSWRYLIWLTIVRHWRCPWWIRTILQQMIFRPTSVALIYWLLNISFIISLRPSLLLPLLEHLCLVLLDIRTYFNICSGVLGDQAVELFHTLLAYLTIHRTMLHDEVLK